MKKIFLLSLLVSTFFTLYAQENVKLRVAVFDPSSSGTTIDEGTKVAVRELISSTFVNTGDYNIVERSLLEKVMNEQEFSNSGAVDDTQATEVGKLAGANKVVISVVTLVGGRNMLSIKMIDVQTATIEQQKTKIVNTNDLLDIVEPLTAELLGKEMITAGQTKGSKKEQNDVQTGIQTREQAPVRKAMTKKEQEIELEKQRQEQRKQRKEQAIALKEQKIAELNEQEKAIALSSPNSYDIAASLSNLIFDAIKDYRKSGKYTNDEERFANLKENDRIQIVNYITSVTTNVASFPDENSDRIVFYCKRVRGREAPILLFLDGKCIGAGTINKGLLTKIPAAEFTGMHSITLWNSERMLLNIPVDFSFKTYYQFEWNRGTVRLITLQASPASERNIAAVTSKKISYE
jgi:hypothetical protein